MIFSVNHTKIFAFFRQPYKKFLKHAVAFLSVFNYFHSEKCINIRLRQVFQAIHLCTIKRHRRIFCGFAELAEI